MKNFKDMQSMKLLYLFCLFVFVIQSCTQEKTLFHYDLGRSKFFSITKNLTKNTKFRIHINSNIDYYHSPYSTVLVVDILSNSKKIYSDSTEIEKFKSGEFTSKIYSGYVKYERSRDLLKDFLFTTDGEYTFEFRVIGNELDTVNSLEISAFVN